jgi:cytochrome c
LRGGRGLAIAPQIVAGLGWRVSVDSFEWNKIAGGVLAAFLLMMVFGTVGETLFEHETQAKPSYVPDGCVDDRTCGESKKGGTVVIEKVEPLANLLIAAAATPEKGADTFKQQCSTCHNTTKGGPNGSGPNLWGVLGGSHAHASGFPYSSGMAALKGKSWTWEALNDWVANPKTVMPATKMAFAGISNPAKRAQLLVYLNAQSDKPLALPAAVKVEAVVAPPGDNAKTADATVAAGTAKK